MDTNNSSDHQPIEAPSGVDLHPQPQKAVRISRRASMAIVSVIVLLLIRIRLRRRYDAERSPIKPLLAMPVFQETSLRQLRRARSSCRQLRQALYRWRYVLPMRRRRRRR